MIEKKTKIVVCLMLIFTLIFTVSCGSSDTASNVEQADPYEMYVMVSDRVKELSAIEAQLTTSVFINNSVESLELNMTSDIKQIGNHISGAELEMITSTNYLDESLTVASYYTDGYYYTDYEGEKIKYKFSNEDMMTENHLALPEIDEDHIKESSVEIDTENNSVITLLLDPEAFSDISVMLKGAFINEKTEFFNCSYITLVLKADEQGNIKSCDYLISMNITEEGVTTEYTIDAYIEYLSVNEKIEIQFPDLSEYTEIFADEAGV